MIWWLRLLILWNIRGTLGTPDDDSHCLQFGGASYIENHFANGPLFSANERLDLQFRTGKANSPLLFIGSKDSYYDLSLRAGLLHLRIRLPAEVILDQPAEAITATASVNLGAFKWFRSDLAGYLSVSETLRPFSGLQTHLDDGQLHDIELERSADNIQLRIDEQVVFRQSLGFENIRAGFLEIRNLSLGMTIEGEGEKVALFEGQFVAAILQIDDTTLNILQMAKLSLHGFEIIGSPLYDCVNKSPSLASVHLQDIYLLLRLEKPAPLLPLFGHLKAQSHLLTDWQQIEVNFTSFTKDSLLFLWFKDPTSPFLAAEFREGRIWIVNKIQAWDLQTETRGLLRIGVGNVALNDENRATIIAAGNDEELEFFVAVNGDLFRKAFKAEVGSILNTAIEGERFEDSAVGRFLLLGGSNWTAEAQMDRGLDQLWSGLGRRKRFSGCIYRLSLNGVVVDFDPIIQSRLKYSPLTPSQKLQLGCQTPDAQCACENGGFCENGACNCLETAFTGESCTLPAKILLFDGNRQLRMRFPLPQQLRATEIRFAFKTTTTDAIVLTTQPLGDYQAPNEADLTGEMNDEINVSVWEGWIVVMVKLDGQRNVYRTSAYIADGGWHTLQLLRTGSILRVVVDRTPFNWVLPEEQAQKTFHWPLDAQPLIDGDEQQTPPGILLSLGASSVPHEVIDAENLVMRIQEMRIGQWMPIRAPPFVGEIRHFTFNGIDPLSDFQYLVETPQLKVVPSIIPLEVEPAITLKTPDCYLRTTGLNLFGAFKLAFSLKTHQEDGILLFCSGGGDFLLAELVRTQLTISLDMGHGAALQHQRVGRGFLSDGNWHRIIISRDGQMDEVMKVRILSEFGDEEEQNLVIPSVNSARNFNFREPLYLGGIPNDVRVAYSEKIISKHGIQGCIGGLSANDHTGLDVYALAETTYGANRTSAVCKWQVLKGCLTRPTEALTCTTYAIQHQLPYCLNGGVCLHVWTSLRCSCEMTTFTGNRCHLPGTSLKFDSSLDGVVNGSGEFVRFTHLHDQQSTNREEIALGMQVSAGFCGLERCSLLYVDTRRGNEDFLHIFLDKGLATLVFNMGGGVVHLQEQRRRLNDGGYHRIRVFRHGFATLLEVDELTTKHVSNGPLGEQFNEQHSIWLGFAPAIANFTSLFRGVLSGVFYNGLPLTDLAAGLSHRADIHVTRHVNVRYLANFRINLPPNSVFKELPSEELVNTEPTSYHDDETVIKALDPPNHSSETPTIPIPSGPSPPYSNATSGVELGLLHDWIQFPSRDRSSADIPPLYAHVSIWLFVSLAAAGVAVVASILFLLFHCLRRRLRRQPETAVHLQNPPEAGDQTIGEMRLGHPSPAKTRWDTPATLTPQPISYVAFSEPFAGALEPVT